MTGVLWVSRYASYLDLMIASCSATQVIYCTVRGITFACLVGCVFAKKHAVNTPLRGNVQSKELFLTKTGVVLIAELYSRCPKMVDSRKVLGQEKLLTKRKANGMEVSPLECLQPPCPRRYMSCRTLDRH